MRVLKKKNSDRPQQQKQVSLVVKTFDMLSKKSCKNQILNSVEVPSFVVSALSHLRLRQVWYILGPKFRDEILIREVACQAAVTLLSSTGLWTC